MLVRRIAALLLALAVPLAHAAPKSELWQRWSTHDAQSTRSVDHSAWSAFLQRNVRVGDDGINRIAYGAVSAEDLSHLRIYLRDLQREPVSKLSRAEQRAYWINLYNATTVDTVLAHYPVESILDIGISPGLFARGPWGKKLLRIENEDVSLDDIEHRILRPIWQDPRTHYAVNCASLGCPNLQPEAFTAANMDALLDKGARAYVNHPRGARVDNGKLYVSSIYEWFKSDFGGSDAGVIAHLKRYADAPLAKALAGVEKISDDEYDWALNEAR